MELREKIPLSPKETCYLSAHIYDSQQAKRPATSYCQRKGLYSTGARSDRLDRSNLRFTENNDKASMISTGQDFTLCPVVTVHGTEIQENSFVSVFDGS